MVKDSSAADTSWRREGKGRVEEEEFWVVELPQDISAEKHKSEGGGKSMLKRTSLSDPSS